MHTDFVMEFTIPENSERFFQNVPIKRWKMAVRKLERGVEKGFKAPFQPLNRENPAGASDGGEVF